MAETLFTAQTRMVAGAAVVDLRGDIDGRAEAALNAAYGEAAQHHPQRVVLNFTAVQYINSTGIALIVGLLAQSRKAGHKLLVIGLNPHYTEIFHITRLSDFMTIAPDEQTALSAA